MPTSAFLPTAAAVQHGAVADVAVFLDDGIGAGEAVHDAGVLQVGAAFEDEPAEVAAQAGAGADIAARPDDDVADQHGAGVHEGGGIDDGDDAVDGVNAERGHGITLGWRERTF